MDDLWKSSIADQATIVLRLAQSWWFAREMRQHPIAAHATQQHLDLNEIALAQHYGLATGYLDLTDDFDVGAFFATCHQTKNGWEPVVDGVGVIYRVLLTGLDSPFGRYEPVGPQQLPRPSEQCAWVTELPLCHSFEGWPNVSVLQFRHDKTVGEHFLNMFAEGESLFPFDPLANVADEILACGEVPSDLVDAALNSFAGDPCGVRQVTEVRKEISRMVKLVSYRSLLTEANTSALETDSEWCNKMLADVRVKWCAVRRVPIPFGGENQEVGEDR